MKPEEQIKNLDAAFKDAMEGIKAFNKAMREDIDNIKDYLGVK